MSTLVLQVPPLLEVASENALSFARQSVQGGAPYGRSTGYVYWTHDLPATTVSTPVVVSFPQATGSSQATSGQLPGPGPVVWLNQPATYVVTATVAWTSALQPRAPAAAQPVPVSPPAPATGPAPTADDVPYDLKTVITAVCGTMTAGKPVWGTDSSMQSSIVASMNTITPRAMGPISPLGTASKWYPNFVTQTVTTTLTVPPGQFGSLSLQSAASIMFSRMPQPVLYSMSIVQLAAPAASLVPPASALAALPVGARGAQGTPPAASTPTVSYKSAAYIVPVTLIGAFAVFGAVCGVLYLVNKSKRRQAAPSLQ